MLRPAVFRWLAVLIVTLGMDSTAAFPAQNTPQALRFTMNQSIKNAAAISATITRNSEEIRRMFSESYRQRSESQDRISQSFSEYIHGVICGGPCGAQTPPGLSVRIQHRIAHVRQKLSQIDRF